MTTLAVDPGWQRRIDRHPPAAGAGRLGRRAGVLGADPGGADGQRRRPGAVPSLRLRPRRRASQLLRRDQRGCLGHVGPRHRRSQLRPAERLAAIGCPPGAPRDRPEDDIRHGGARHRDQLRRDGGGGGRRRHRRALVGGLQPGRPPRPLRRGRARDRQPGPRRAAGPGGRRGAGGVGPRGRRHRRRGRHRGARSGRIPARRCGRGQGAGPGVGRARSSGSTTSKPISTPPSSTSRRSSRRWWPCWSRGATPAGGRRGPRRLPGPRLHHRRRRRRGVRQGGPLPRARLPRRPGHRPGGRRRRSHRHRLPPGHARPGLRLQLLGTQDRGGQLRAPPSRRVHRGRRRQLPAGRGRRAGDQDPPGGPRNRSQQPVPGRRGGGQLTAARALRRRLRRTACMLRAQPVDVHRQRRHGGRRRVVAPALGRARRRSTPAPIPTSACRWERPPSGREGRILGRGLWPGTYR